MAQQSTNRVKCNAPLGSMPTLQFCRPAELRIDPVYQRDISSGPSQGLIRRIAQFWNWDLCQPLVVARRTDLTERLFVIDGQHRLAAAALRGDIDQLPCVIVNFGSVADEAASFVHLNQQRRPLSKIELFKAAIASGDGEATAIVQAMAVAGLTVAPHQNYITWKPGMVSNIGGIERAWRIHGETVTSAALRALAGSFGGQVLQYAGTLFPGIAAVCADEMGGAASGGRFDPARFERFQTMLACRTQKVWRDEVLRTRGENPEMRYDLCAALALRQAWGKASENAASPVSAPVRSSPAAWPASPDGKAWCDQCEMRVTSQQAQGCKSRFCALRARKGDGA